MHHKTFHRLCWNTTVCLCLLVKEIEGTQNQNLEVENKIKKEDSTYMDIDNFISCGFSQVLSFNLSRTKAFSKDSKWKNVSEDGQYFLIFV